MRVKTIVNILKCLAIAASLFVSFAALAATAAHNLATSGQVSAKQGSSSSRFAAENEIAPAFVNLMYLVTEAAKPTREDVKFIDWWAKYFDDFKFQEATKNEIAIAGLRDATLKKIQSTKGKRLLYTNIPVHLGKYDTEKEEFTVEFPFYDGEKESGNRRFLPHSRISYPEGFGVWDATLKDFNPGLYVPFANSEKITPDWSLVFSPNPDGLPTGSTVLYVKANIKNPPPWGKLHIPRGQAKDLLDWLLEDKILYGKFVFNVVGDAQLSAPKTYYYGVLRSEYQLRHATVDIEPLALYLWTSKYQKAHTGDIESKLEDAGVDERREHESFYKFLGAIGNVANSSQAPSTSADGPLRVVLTSTSSASTTELPADNEPASSRTAPVARSGDKNTSSSTLVVPSLPPEKASSTLKAPKINAIPTKE